MAQPIPTHYDNLKVRRDAPVGVIKTSYRKLSQKYHPDRNPDPSALEIMKLINLAWDVLSDPERRARHDRAIATLELRAHAKATPAAARPRAAPSHSPRSAPAPAPPSASISKDTVRLAGIFAIALVLVIAAFQFSGNDADVTDVTDVTGVTDQPAVTRAVAQVMLPSPPLPVRLSHGYLITSAQDMSPGLAAVEIDNKAGKLDTEVRLFINGRSARSMFVHYGQRFEVKDLAPGTYVIKYRIEVDGKIRTFQEREPFQPQRGKSTKLKLKVPDVKGAHPTVDEIAPDSF